MAKKQKKENKELSRWAKEQLKKISELKKKWPKQKKSRSKK